MEISEVGQQHKLDQEIELEADNCSSESPKTITLI